MTQPITPGGGDFTPFAYLWTDFLQILTIGVLGQPILKINMTQSITPGGGDFTPFAYLWTDFLQIFNIGV